MGAGCPASLSQSLRSAFSDVRLLSLLAWSCPHDAEGVGEPSACSSCVLTLSAGRQVIVSESWDAVLMRNDSSAMLAAWLTKRAKS
jgi:hypothetical protein